MGRLFNKNNLKVSYSCTRNVKSILAAHNKKVLRESEDTRRDGEEKCNCRGGPGSCPLRGRHTRFASRGVGGHMGILSSYPVHISQIRDRKSTLMQPDLNVSDPVQIS